MATRMNDSDEQGSVRLDCCTIQPFRLTGDSHSLAEKWKGGKGLLICTFVAKASKTTSKRKACYCIARDWRCKTCITLW